MVGMIALLTVLGLSLVITRLAAISLSMTGLSRESASFQARSAFTGTGFTTSESERIVDHPVRRRIIMALMVVRSAGLATVLISLVLSFIDTAHEAERLVRALWIIGAVAALLAFAHLPVIDRGMEGLIGWALRRWSNLDASDSARLLKLSGDYAVIEMQVKEGDWVEDRQLGQCDLAAEGVAVLAIQRRGGDYVGAPRETTPIYADDTLILYGRAGSLFELDRRSAGVRGDKAHRKAAESHQRYMWDQARRERDFEQRRPGAAGREGEDEGGRYDAS